MVAASICYCFSVIRTAYCPDERQRFGTVYLYDILVCMNEEIFVFKG